MAGRLHRLNLEHRVLGSDSCRPRSGGSPTRVRGPAGRLRDRQRQRVERQRGYEVDFAPSMRMVVDLANLDGSTWINQTGVSGHPTDDHYADQVDDWIAGRQRPWPFTEAAVRDMDPDVLTLRPEGATQGLIPRSTSPSAVRTASTGWSWARRGSGGLSAPSKPWCSRTTTGTPARRRGSTRS